MSANASTTTRDANNASYATQVPEAPQTQSVDDAGYKHLKLVQTEPRGGEESSLTPHIDIEMKSSLAMNSEQDGQPVIMELVELVEVARDWRKLWRK